MGRETIKRGSELLIGDTLNVWWGARKLATVTRFSAHDSGKHGWFVVDFNDGVSMTVTPKSVYTVREA